MSFVSYLSSLTGPHMLEVTPDFYLHSQLTLLELARTTRPCSELLRDFEAQRSAMAKLLHRSLDLRT